MYYPQNNMCLKVDPCSDRNRNYTNCNCFIHNIIVKHIYSSHLQSCTYLKYLIMNNCVHVVNTHMSINIINITHAFRLYIDIVLILLSYCVNNGLIFVYTQEPCILAYVLRSEDVSLCNVPIPNKLTLHSYLICTYFSTRR